MRCVQHNRSKISSNRTDFLQTYRGVKRVAGDLKWVHSVLGISEIGDLKVEKYFENFLMLIRAGF